MRARPNPNYRRDRYMGHMAGLAPSDLQTYAANAGFSGNALATAVAVALAESGGNPNAYNPETAAGAPTGKGSYGLWQIYLNAHPEFAGLNLMDPQTNANAAFSVYSAAGGFAPWSTYKSGAYVSFLSSVPSSPAAPNFPDTSVASAIPPPLTIDATTGEVLDDLTPTPMAASLLPTSIAGLSQNQFLLLTAAGIGAYLLADTLWGD
jgi:hypothetical protein